MIILIGICLALLVLGFAIICREIEDRPVELITKKRWNKRDKKVRFCK